MAHHRGSVERVSLSQTTRERTPALSFVRIKNAVLGKKYELSIVFIGDTRSRALNKRWRGKNAPANVLSFPLSKDSGELFINMRQAARDRKRFAMPQTTFVGYLFIHGLLHLEGHRHGGTMESKERRLLRRFFPENKHIEAA